MACVSIMGFAKGYTMLAIMAPVLVLGIPIFDTLFAMIRRFLKGQPMLKPDGAHIHHRLIKMGLSQRQAVLLLYTITTILCMIAVLIISADIWKLVLLIFAFVFFVVLGVVSMLRGKNIKDHEVEINKNFDTGPQHSVSTIEENKDKIDNKV